MQTPRKSSSLMKDLPPLPLLTPVPVRHSSLTTTIVQRALSTKEATVGQNSLQDYKPGSAVAAKTAKFYEKRYCEIPEKCIGPSRKLLQPIVSSYTGETIPK